MSSRAYRLRALTITCAVALGGMAGCGCASGVAPAREALVYRGEPTSDDPWTPKISAWQLREREIPSTEALRSPASVSGGVWSREATARSAPDLRSKYFEFREERRRELARGLAEWIQAQARHHYVPDGPVDHWATLEETLDRNGDDCDGLELLVYHFLRDMGFGDDRVFRAVVYRPEDGQHHMVTFWFEDPADPWVIDPTGAMTSGMPRMSEVPGWVPLKVFSETRSFTVEREPSPLLELAAPAAARR